LKQLGNPHNFKTLDKIKALKIAKKLSLEIIVGGISSDYLVVRWWAQEMRRLGEKLVEVRSFLKDKPNIDPDNHDLAAVRRNLAEHLKGVASRTKEQFGDPWGLVAMDLATGRAARAKVQVTGTRVAFARERETA
jgi:hypothetical protein